MKTLIANSLIGTAAIVAIVAIVSAQTPVVKVPVTTDVDARYQVLWQERNAVYGWQVLIAWDTVKGTCWQIFRAIPQSPISLDSMTAAPLAVTKIPEAATAAQCGLK